jgi:DsbC/DsbD-like thiol-disulfide interchange protein
MMKRSVLVVLVSILMMGMYAQGPVKWSFSATKVSPGVYNIHMTASIQPGWHIYAQEQPSDAIALPTAIQFTQNPLIAKQGDIKEVGHKEQFKDADLGITAFQYEEKVDFVQQVKLKIKGKTNLGGNVTYQACTNEKCLPPTTTKFNINLEP